MVSGFLRALVVLLLFALHIDSKAVSLLRQKRAPGIQHPRLGRRSENFHVSYKRFQHPRLGRKRAIDEDDPWNFLHYPRAGRSNFFAYPRGGRSMPVTFPKPTQDNDNSDVDDVCCTGLKTSWISGQEPDIQQLLCKCCDGLTTRVVRRNMNTYALCAPVQKFDNTDEDTSI